MSNLPPPIPKKYLKMIIEDEREILRDRCDKYILKNGHENTEQIEDIVNRVEIPPLLRLLGGLDIIDDITGKSISIQKTK